MTDELAIIPWYTSAESYEKFRTAATDRDSFFDTYQQWRQAALDHELQAEKFGVVIIRSRIDFDQFESWRKQQKCENNHHARSQFATLQAQKNLGEI